MCFCVKLQSVISRHYCLNCKHFCDAQLQVVRSVCNNCVWSVCHWHQSFSVNTCTLYMLSVVWNNLMCFRAPEKRTVCLRYSLIVVTLVFIVFRATARSTRSTSCTRTRSVRCAAAGWGGRVASWGHGTASGSILKPTTCTTMPHRTKSSCKGTYARCQSAPASYSIVGFRTPTCTRVWRGLYFVKCVFFLRKTL